MAKPKPTPSSANFRFLAVHDRLLDQLGALAERYFRDDPSTCLVKLRQFAEVLAQRTAASAGLYASDQDSQLDLLRRLRDHGLLPREVGDMFHNLRRVGNAATHEARGDHREALYQLRMASELGVWFHRTFAERDFKPGPFVPPADPADESEALAAEPAALRERYAAQQSAAEAARLAAEREAELRLSAEQRAAKQAEERELWEQLAAELVEDGDVVDKMVYTQANPVAARLVERACEWTGATSAGMAFGEVRRVARPQKFFRDDMPEFAEFELKRPRCFAEVGDDALLETVEANVARLEREHEQRGPAMGMAEVLRQDHESKPGSREARRVLQPTIACKNPVARVEALRAAREWLDAYKAALARFVDGVRDVVFPRGIWWMCAQLRCPMATG